MLRRARPFLVRAVGAPRAGGFRALSNDTEAARHDSIAKKAAKGQPKSRLEEAFSEFREGRSNATAGLSAVNVVAERKIAEAMRDGQFDALDGAGKPRQRTAFNEIASASGLERQA